MERIISVSRRTDIPAFYGDWFMGRLKEGFAGVVNPFGGRKYIVSLRPQDTIAFVFWSKNYQPFIENLRTIEQMGYRFYFNYTVTALPQIFESTVDKRTAIEALKRLSRTYSPKHINWRFDPIIISSISDRDFYISAFETLASELTGYVQRCYFSFVTEYDKVRRNFNELERAAGIRIAQVDDDFRIALANELGDIADRYGIEMFSCCGDYLVNEKIKKAHCVDGEIIEQLFYPGGFVYSERPTRAQCGCTESTDIGAYNTCAAGCVYCYANTEKLRVIEAAESHEADSAFLGHSKFESDKWLAEIKNSKTEQDCKQMQIWVQ